MRLMYLEGSGYLQPDGTYKENSRSTARAFTDNGLLSTGHEWRPRYLERLGTVEQVQLYFGRTKELAGSLLVGVRPQRLQEWLDEQESDDDIQRIMEAFYA